MISSRGYNYRVSASNRRESFGGDGALIRTRTHSGSDAAASEWAVLMDIVTIRPSRSDSYEVLYRAARQPRILPLDVRLNPDFRRAVSAAAATR